MADEGTADTFEYPVNGRVLTLRKLSRSQLEMLRRYIEGLQKKSITAIENDDVETVVELGKKMAEATWTTVESQFLISDDLEWVQMEVLANRLKEEDLMPLLSNGYKPVAVVQDDADPAPAKKPGRKAPAKKAAAVAKSATPRAKR